MQKYLGIDYGIKRIGLAVANSDAKIARPLATVTIKELLAVIGQEGPFETIVVGLPRGLDGQETAQTLLVRHFVDDVLWPALHVEPVFQDEAGTSAVAEERLRESGKPYVKASIDAEAAAIILQDYIDSRE